MNKKSIDIAIALPIPLPNITTLATRRWTACPSTQSTNSSSPNSNLAGPAWTSVPWEWWHATKKRLTWGGRRKSMALLESKRQSSIYIICGFSVYPESKLWHISCSCILPPFTDKSPRVTALAHTYILDHLAAVHKQASKKKVQRKHCDCSMKRPPEIGPPNASYTKIRSAKKVTSKYSWLQPGCITWPFSRLRFVGG